MFLYCISWIYSSRKPKHSLAWTQVCRFWRDTSLTSPRIWNCIDLCNVNYARELLLRSRPAPISIISDSPLRLFQDDLREHAGRLQSIDVFLFPNDLSAFFASLGNKTQTTGLVDLSLKVPTISQNYRLDIPFPSVRRLCLEAVSIQWEFCRKMTHLTLRGLTEADSPTLLQLYAILDSSASLEYLNLENIEPLRNLDSVPRIHLDEIKEIELTGNPKLSYDILSLLSLPNTVQIRILCAYNLFTDCYALFPGTSSVPYFQTIAVEVNTICLARHAVSFSRCTRHLYSSSTGSVSEVPPVLTIASTRLASTASHSLDAIVHPHLITTLELSSSLLVDIRFNDFTKLLSSFRNLDSLVVGFNHLTDLLAILSSDSPCCCPKLRCVTFGRRKEVWWKFRQTWFDGVVECFRVRAGKGNEVALVRFVWCAEVGEVEREVMKKAISVQVEVVEVERDESERLSLSA